jgi:hypothetical protein
MDLQELPVGNQGQEVGGKGSYRPQRIFPDFRLSCLREGKLDQPGSFQVGEGRLKVVTPEESPADIVGNAPAIFLVGPSPRDSATPSWRPEAVETLKNIGFEGIVFVPERESWNGVDYLDQVEWEHETLQYASYTGCIAAWVPRELEKMPAFTTNVEFGRFVDCGRFAYGRPDGAPKTGYLDWLYGKETGLRPCNSLAALMALAVEICGRK